METKKILFYVIAGILGGCIPVMTLNPFYDDSNIVFEEKLLGSWVDDTNEPDTTWNFFRGEDDPNNSYKLILTDNEGKKGIFTAHLVKLDNKLFFDLYPSEMPTEDPNKVDWEYNGLFFLPVHTFIKIDNIDSQLILRTTLQSKMKELFEEHPNAIEYKEIEDRLIITSSTKELQAFVLKYLEDERLFSDKITLDRMTNKTSKP
ncbi:MAG: hypothetical protein JW787_03770 [Sedimentisphaerales bacterium]|nr:hypothetical protein [Sedimentisphaerales bacterium]